MADGKRELLRAGEKVVLQHGFQAAGVIAITESAGLSKAAFFHHFKDKEEFGVELAKVIVENEVAQLKSIFTAAHYDAAQKLNLFWNSTIGRMMAGDFRLDSPILKLGVEAMTLSPAMRQVLAKGMERARGIFEDAIREGQRQGVVNPKIASGEAASLIQDRWNGAVLRATLEADVSVADAAAKALRASLGITGTGAGLPKS